MVLARAARRSKRQIEELIAELAPKADVPATIRKLPTPPPAPLVQLRPDAGKPSIRGPTSDFLDSEEESRYGVEISETPRPVAPTKTLRPVSPAAPQPLSPERFKVTFTASRGLKEKLERLQALTDADLEAVIEAAVTEKLERLEARRYGGTTKHRKRPVESNTRPKSRYVPAAVRRKVWERDGGRCAFVDGSGRRCKDRQRLEFHHDDPYSLGGDHNPDTMRLLCKRHNLHLAELVYGKEVMERYRNKGGRVSEKTLVYGFIHGVHRRELSSFESADAT